MGYSSAAIGSGLAATAPAILFLSYMTDNLGVSAAIAGILLFIPKVWSLVFDPVVGLVSDSTRSRFGRRRPYILGGGLLMAGSFVLLFNTPVGLEPMWRYLYLGIGYFVLTASFSIFLIPYAAMQAEISDDTHERTTIASYRLGFAYLGVLLGGAAGPFIIDQAGGGTRGYGVMGWCLGLIVLVAVLITFFRTARLAPATDAHVPLGNVRSSVADMVRLTRDRPYMVLVGGYLAISAATGMFNAIIPYFVQYTVGMSLSVMGALYSAATITSMLAVIPWNMLSRRIGKLNAFRAAALLLGLPVLFLSFATPQTSMTQLFAGFILYGFAIGGAVMLAFSILTDVIEHAGRKTKTKRAGSYTGLWIFAEKLGTAGGAALTAAVLAVAAYVEGTDGALATQPASAELAFRLVIGLPLLVGGVLAALLIGRLARAESSGTAAS
jgi:Na+/melibiose symporter-like transporter